MAGGEFSIGRAPENDWVLPDPERALSKRHCVLTFLRGPLAGRRSFDQRHVSEPRGRADRPRSKPRAAQRRPALVRRLRDRGACRGRGAGAAPDHTGGPVRGASLGDARIVRARSVHRRLRAARERGSGRIRCSGEGAGSEPVADAAGASAVALPADFDPLAPRSCRARVPRPDPVGSLSASRRTPCRHRCPRACCPTIGIGTSRSPGALGYVRRSRCRSPFRLVASAPAGGSVRLPTRCPSLHRSEAVSIRRHGPAPHERRRR